MNLAYIRFLRDRVQSPELSDAEFFAAKLAKLKSEREQVELSMQIVRGQRIPIEDALAAWKFVFGSITGILKANRNKLLTEAQINEIFYSIRSARLHASFRHYGNGQHMGNTDSADGPLR